MTPNQRALLDEIVSLLGGEAVFRPSSIDRVILCPGSVVLSARLPRQKLPMTQPQQEGSAAHKVAEDALKGIRQPDEWSDRMVRLTDIHGWFADEEMVEGVGLYVSEVESREGPGTERFVERQLSLAPLDPSDPLFAQNRGTGDCVIVDRRRRRLTVADLKYGKGVMVPGDSPQLRNYALMAMASVGLGDGWETIETVVVQPRAFGESERVKSVLFSPAELLDGFLPTLVSAMEEALDPNARLNPSEKACRWCPAKDVCPALRDRAFNMARDAFMQAPLIQAAASAVQAPPVLVGTVEESRPVARKGESVLPSPLVLDPADIATVLDRLDLYDVFAKAVRQRAAQMLQAGMSVPGWALEPRTGNRRWKEPESIPEAFDTLGATGKDLASLLRALGLKTADLYPEPKIKSPAQIEKLVARERRGLIGLLTERPEGEPALVRASVDSKKLAIHGLGPYKTEAAGA